MARILITGSSDGLGSLTAKQLITRGHQVVLHARNNTRAKDANTACPGAEAVLVADFTSMAEIKNFATEANKLGRFDAVLHNAGLYVGHEQKSGPDGISNLLAVNTVAPYILTCLLDRPKRLTYVSSGLAKSSSSTVVNNLEKTGYSESKLHNIMLAKAFSRHFQGVESNSVDPGWVATKMGGKSASGDLDAAVASFVMLALGEDAAKGKTGKHFFNAHEASYNHLADNIEDQDTLLSKLAEISGVQMSR